jgi:signal transduction histidine kinase
MEADRKVPPKIEAFDPQTEKLISAFIERYRFSALGVLTKGVIHNLNGILQVLSMRMEFLQGALIKEDEKVRSGIHLKIDPCQEQMEKLKGVMETLILKSIHDEQDGPQEISLNDLLEEELSLLQHHLFFKHQVTLNKRFSPGLPVLRGYYVDFSQGLSNLIQNAIEAMEETEEKALTVITELREPHVQVSVRDTGCGLSEAVTPHLFKPFFTTKGGSHPGLGLFIAQRIFASYGASLTYSEKKGETTFSVGFPLRKQKEILEKK